ncbi:MAG: adhesin [Hyphomicrobium sp.]
MFAFVCRAKPAFLGCALAAVIGLAGCSSAGSSRYSAENTTVSPARAVAQAAVEMEDDGLPSQTPPSVSIRQLPDDPNEPFSRNYGGGNPAAVEAASPQEPGKTPGRQPVVPADLPPAFRQKLVTALAQDE